METGKSSHIYGKIADHTMMQKKRERERGREKERGWHNYIKNNQNAK